MSELSITGLQTQLTNVSYSIGYSYDVLIVNQSYNPLSYQTLNLIKEPSNTILDSLYFTDSILSEHPEVFLPQFSKISYYSMALEDGSGVNSTDYILGYSYDDLVYYILELPLVGEDYDINLTDKLGNTETFSLSDAGIDYTISSDTTEALISILYSSKNIYEVHNLDLKAHNALVDWTMKFYELKLYIDSDLWSLLSPESIIYYENEAVYYDSEYVYVTSTSGATYLVLDKRNQCLLGVSNPISLTSYTDFSITDAVSDGTFSSTSFNFLMQSLKSFYDTYESTASECYPEFIPFFSYAMNTKVRYKNSNKKIGIYKSIVDTDGSVSPIASPDWIKI